ESIDWVDQQVKKVVCEAEIELLHGVEFQPAPKERNLRSDVIPPGGNCAPVEPIRRYRKNIALLISRQEKKKRLMTPEQLLHILDLQRFRIGQRGIVGEFLLQPSFRSGQLALRVFELPANVVDLRRVRLRCWFRQGFD